MDFDKKTFAANLKSARNDAGLTQSVLSERCGIPQSALSTYESAKSDKVPRLDDAIQMAKELGVSLDWLCGLSESSQTITPIQWLLYTDKLLNAPHPVMYINHSGDPPKPRIVFDLSRTDKFLTDYCNLRQVRTTIGDELYSSAVIQFFEKNRHLFTPGAEVDNNGKHKKDN